MKSAPWIALLCVLLGAVALHLYQRGYELSLPGAATQSLLVVTRDLAQGDVITRSVIEVHELPERYVEARHIAAADLERVLGSRTSSFLPGGSSLLWSDLALTQEEHTLAALVRTGMRAYALPDPDVSFDGLLRPGDRVDVLFLRSSEQWRSSTLVQNALVLTVPGELGSEMARATGGARESGRVTLSVTLAQAQLLAQAEQRGKLRLALRNPQDLALAHEPASVGPSGRRP